VILGGGRIPGFGIGFREHLPSGYVKIAIENTTFIVDFLNKNGDFP